MKGAFDLRKASMFDLIGLLVNRFSFEFDCQLIGARANFG
ncbi:hypothetical protein VCHA50O413_20870 [Vibrio chagasii]|nr:hypothetical protein VCHA27O13_60043 [Vibrio chagasii]CAH6819087.1 hypothetical protein VCHA36P168_130035 [Vibrio chagasii]CAH6834025.1 hypothetical protein VCHA30O60_10041 [Vibrio chagasii]CAH6859929.1 hypothetical protein VCHA36P164_10703 [Vibrio chagasii]CAH6873155.1 hypothetical protein VCHA34P112_280036 [Vibrio chagasii]